MRKIFYNENPIIDLSNITVTPEALFSGSRCLNSNGEIINGTVVPLENTTELVKVYVATNHDTYGATGRYTFEFTYADDSGLHTVSCKNGDSSYVMLPTNSVIVEKCDVFSSLGFTQQATNTSSSITTLYSHAIRDSFPYVMFYVTGEGTLYFYTSEAYILWSGLQTIYQWKRHNITTTTGYAVKTYQNNFAPSKDAYNSYYITQASSYSFDSTSGLYTLTSIYSQNYVSTQTISAGCYFTIGTSDYLTTTDLIYYAPEDLQLKTYYSTGYSSYIFGIPHNNSEYDWVAYYSTTSTINVCGSYIDIVTSTSRNTYPDNNQSNGYWYIYNGTTTEGTTYSLLSAIKSTGTQYIDTGLVANKSDTYEILLDAQLTNNTNYAGANGYLQYQANIAGGARANIKISYNGSTCVENIYVNNVLSATQNWTSSYDGTNVKIGILALGDTNNSWWSGGSPQSGTVYSVKITKSGVLVRDFVPAQSNSGVVGLFDKCNNVFYTNAGTGIFTAIE